MNGDSANAVAGPSNLKASSSPSLPQLFLSPPAPPTTHPPHLSSTQDLLARFSLLSAYDKYVRPFAAPAEIGLDQNGPASTLPSASGVPEKGKGKEVMDTPGSSGIADGGDGDDDEATGKGEKKKKNTYKHLIKGVPGKHSMKRDDYLSTIMQVPPKQRIKITPFDPKTQRDAFTVSLEGLKGWNPNALVLESAQAREDRKKRKELKRLAKIQHAHPQPIQAPIPTSTTMPSLHRVLVSVVTQRLGSTVPRPTSGPGSAVPRPGSSSTLPKQSSVPVSIPDSTFPRPGPTKPALPPVQVPVGRVATPSRSAGTATPTSAVQSVFSHPVEQEKRGQKRERDDDSVTEGVNGVGAVNGSANMSPPKAILNAKAGMAGIRPRPIKKLRMDIQGQSRDVTVAQQPTPQGV